MLNREIVYQDLRLMEDAFALPAGGGRELSLLLVVAQEATAALARAREHDAAIEAQDVLSQADEALVSG
jgi:hypothetical protein